MRLQRILYLERRARGSARAFAYAARRAKERGAGLTLAGVARGGGMERLLELADRLDVPVRVHGEPGLELSPGVLEDHELVITVARGRGARWFGTGDPVVQTLVRSCDCPVWVLHPAQGPQTRVVLAGVDIPSPPGSSGRRALRWAADLAADAGAALYVVHCWSVMGESMLASRSRGGSHRGARRVLASAERSRREALEALLREEAIEPAGVVLQKAPVAPGLREVSWRLEADVVVVGATPSAGLGLLASRTAERLSGWVPASVVVIPAGRGDPSIPSRDASRSAVPHSPRYPRPSRTSHPVS